MRFTALLSIVSIAVSSLVSAQSNACRNSDIQFVRTKLAQPKAFCKWYLSLGRTRSPLPRFNAKQMTKLCKCFLPPRERVRARITSTKPKTGRLYCDKTDLNRLKKQFREPKNFCKFYTALYVFVSQSIVATSEPSQQAHRLHRPRSCSRLADRSFRSACMLLLRSQTSSDD